MTEQAGAIVLVGGSSRRMGRPKAFVSVGGQELLERALGATETFHTVLSAREVDEIGDALVRYGWSCTVPGSHGPTCERDGRRLQLLRDRVAGQGPLAGIITGLRHLARPSWVLACDLPFATAALGRALVAELARAPEVEVVVPRFGGRLHGTCAAYRPRVAETAEAVLKRGERSLAALLGSVRLREVGADWLARFGEPDRLLLNVNDPDDLSRAESM